MANSLKKRNPDVLEEVLAIEHSKPRRAPLLMAVGVDKPSEPKVVEIENVCAAAAACQNLLLAAHALGLGAMWRTGPAALDPQVKAFLGEDVSTDAWRSGLWLIDQDRRLPCLVMLG